VTQDLTVYLFMVTGFHRHVGQAGDYAADPDIIGLSWKEGEASSRPLQAFMTSIIASATGLTRPKLMRDYSQVFEGMEKEDEAIAIWAHFQSMLRDVADAIDARNQHRESSNWRSHPAHVEVSVAV